MKTVYPRTKTQFVGGCMGGEGGINTFEISRRQDYVKILSCRQDYIKIFSKGHNSKK